MALSSYDSIPKSRFLAKMTGPMVLAFALGIAAMGFVADPDTFQPKPVTSAGEEYAKLPEGLQGSGGIYHWRLIAYFATHVPEACRSDNAVNDLQKEQCAQMWQRLGWGGLLCLLPFACAWLFWQLALGSLKRVYRIGRKRVESGKLVARGIVTDPARAPEDLFSRVYCLQPIAVQLQGGKQVKVYIPADSPGVEPGKEMGVYEPFQSLGEARHFAAIYAPHVAVVAGVRRG